MKTNIIILIGLLIFSFSINMSAQDGELQYMNLEMFDYDSQTDIIKNYTKTQSIMEEYSKYRTDRNSYIAVTTALGIAGAAYCIESYRISDRGFLYGLTEGLTGGVLLTIATVPLIAAIANHKKGAELRNQAIKMYNDDYYDQQEESTSIDLEMTNNGLGLIFRF